MGMEEIKLNPVEPEKTEEEIKQAELPEEERKRLLEADISTLSREEKIKLADIQKGMVPEVAKKAGKLTIKDVWKGIKEGPGKFGTFASDLVLGGPKKFLQAYDEANLAEMRAESIKRKAEMTSRLQEKLKDPNLKEEDKNQIRLTSEKLREQISQQRQDFDKEISIHKKTDEELAGIAIESGLDIATIGVGGTAVKSLAKLLTKGGLKAVQKAGIKELIKRTATGIVGEGALLGAGYGTAGAMQENKSLGGIAKQAGMTAVAGAGLAGGLGLAGIGASKLLGKLRKEATEEGTKLLEKQTPEAQKELSQDVSKATPDKELPTNKVETESLVKDEKLIESKIEPKPEKVKTPDELAEEEITKAFDKPMTKEGETFFKKSNLEPTPERVKAIIKTRPEEAKKMFSEKVIKEVNEELSGKVSKELEPLAEETRKYKSADEFVKEKTKGMKLQEMEDYFDKNNLYSEEGKEAFFRKETGFKGETMAERRYRLSEEKNRLEKENLEKANKNMPFRAFIKKEIMSAENNKGRDKNFIKEFWLKEDERKILNKLADERKIKRTKRSFRGTGGEAFQDEGFNAQSIIDYYAKIDQATKTTKELSPNLTPTAKPKPDIEFDPKVAQELEGKLETKRPQATLHQSKEKSISKMIEREFGEEMAKTLKMPKLTIDKTLERASKEIAKNPERASAIARGIATTGDQGLDDGIRIAVMKKAKKENFDLYLDSFSSNIAQVRGYAQGLNMQKASIANTSSEVMLKKILDQKLEDVEIPAGTFKDLLSKYGKKDKAKAVREYVEKTAQSAVDSTSKVKFAIAEAQKLLDNLACPT
jgi:hypothetical protein